MCQVLEWQIRTLRNPDGILHFARCLGNDNKGNVGRYVASTSAWNSERDSPELRSRPSWSLRCRKYAENIPQQGNVSRGLGDRWL